jgi:hypothetical protein
MTEGQTPAAGDTAQALYQRCMVERQPYLDRARQASRYTLTSLYPEEGHNGHTKLATPYQSVGARGVNNLSAKLLLTLFPPNSPFFKYQIDDATLEELTQAEGMRGKVEEALASRERRIQIELEGNMVRPSAFEALKLLITGGNVLLYVPDDLTLKVYSLERYAVLRDPMGNITDIIVEEEISPEHLPPEVTGVMKDGPGKGKPKTVKLYTRISFMKGKWRVWQEALGQKVPGTEGVYPKDKSPWIPVRFVKVDGEHYGRGYVEEYIGDLISLEGLWQAVVEGTAMAAQSKWLLNPNGVTRAEDISDTPNGAVVPGMATDVTVLRMDKAGDFQMALNAIGRIEERLEAAFLLHSSIQRKGERVTAEEIRYLASELEAALGGIYSILSQELQLPLAARMEYALERKKALSTLPKGAVRPVIVTGMEALGRGNDLAKLDQFVAPIMQSQEMLAMLHFGEYVRRRAASLGIDAKGLIKTEEEMMAEQQQAQQMAMLQQALPNLVTQGGGMMQQMMNPEQQQMEG